LELLEDRLAPALYAVTADLHVRPLLNASAPGAAASQVVFVESSVAESHVLLNGLLPDIDGVLLDANGDGLRQMATFLAGRQGLDAIHVVAHGQPGAISLGTLSLDQTTLADSWPVLIAIGAALDDEGELDLWSCNVAASSDGIQFVGQLAEAIGGNVAAASHAVGSAALGGSWQLDMHAGPASAPNPFAARARERFNGVLSDIWSPAGTMYNARYHGVATLLPSGKVLVAGGFNRGEGTMQPYNLLSRAELYDPATNTWSAAGSMNAAQDLATATLLSDGKVLVAGGHNAVALFPAPSFTIRQPISGPLPET